MATQQQPLMPAGQRATRKSAPLLKTVVVTSTPPLSKTRRPKGVDLERYVPAFLTWIANKLSRGASQHYLSAFDVGIETWRCLVMLALESSVSAQRISKLVGLDKASVSRCFKSMQARGLIALSLSQDDGRVRIATLTKVGRELHDRIIGIAMERERAFLEVLSEAEREVLIGLLRRLHNNLPEVEAKTERYVAQRFPEIAQRRASRGEEENDE